MKVEIPPARVPVVAIETVDAAGLAYEDFLRRYAHANRPVVVNNAVPRWPALERWKPEYFKARFGKQPVSIAYDKTMPFDEFIDAVAASTEDAPGPYMFRSFLHEHLPELLADLIPQNVYAYPRRYASPLMPERLRRPDGHLKLLIGGPGSKFPVMHYDGDNAHATITEIYGDKEMILYPPEASEFIYVNPTALNTSLVDNPAQPDLERFPLLAQTTQYRAVLQPGQMVFIPARWWHTARPLTSSVSVCTNMIDGSNWSGFVECSCRSTAGIAKRALKRISLIGLGVVLTSFEQLQHRWPRVAQALGFPAKLAPATAAVAPEPSAKQIHFRIPTA